MINNVVLVGRLTRDPELRYTGSGTAVANFTIAADRPFTNAQGERDTDFISCVIWRKQAENLANFARKGSLIGVEGRIQTRNYENNSGQRVYVTEVLADNFQMLEPKSVSDQRRSQSGNQSTTQYQSNDDYSGNQSQSNNQSNNNQAPNFDSFADDPFESNSDEVDISRDNLPF